MFLPYPKWSRYLHSGALTNLFQFRSLLEEDSLLLSWVVAGEGGRFQEVPMVSPATPSIRGLPRTRHHLESGC